MHLCSWNIAGFVDKNTSKIVTTYCNQFDLIFLSEIKTDRHVSLPGFSLICQSIQDGHGGVCLFAKHYIHNAIEILFDSSNLIIFKVSPISNVIFIGAYIEPVGSRYFDPQVFGIIQSYALKYEKVLLFGDLNAHVFIENTNSHGKIILSLAKDNNMDFINDISTYSKENFTFRRKNEWISQIDFLLTSKSLKKNIKCFKINQNLSLPSDHSPIQWNFEYTDLDNTLLRASELGGFSYCDKRFLTRKINCDNINWTLFQQRMNETNNDIHTDNPDILISSLEENIKKLLQDSIIDKRYNSSNIVNSENERWNYILSKKDYKLIWKSIDWSGNIQEQSHNELQPSSAEFIEHFNQLLNPQSEVMLIQNNFTENSPYIPVLDDNFNFIELQHAIKCLKITSGYLGLPAQSIKNCNDEFKKEILHLMNIIFNSPNIPINWTTGKLFLVHKKGSRLTCSNYRGITINDTLEKLYEILLNNRLKLWMDVNPVQAGGQKSRDCIEQIAALRMIIDYVKTKKCKLYMMFVDFNKAYDRIRRSILMEELKKRGCGGKFLSAVQALYSSVSLTIGNDLIETSIGLKQGGTTSSSFFIIYLDSLVKKMSYIENDGFLEDLHLLLLMDDSVVLATSKETLIKKLEVLNTFVEDFNMKINEEKTKLMVINGTQEDKVNLTFHKYTFSYTNHYVYLGADFCEDGLTSSVIRKHVEKSQKQINKFASFIYKNKNMPYKAKKLVADSVIQSSFLYCSETWMNVNNNNIKPLNTQYMTIIKLLLGVRKSTSNICCLAESGYPSLLALIQDRQKKFYMKKLSIINDTFPIFKAFKLIESISTKGHTSIYRTVNINHDFLIYDRENIKATIEKDRINHTKIKTYNILNNKCTIHDIYSNNELIPEHKRLEFTRFRLSSHNLEIESGRWKRIPHINRTCKCDGNAIQDELHVLKDCFLTDHIRSTYNIEVTNLNDFFELENYVTLNMIYEISKYFK